MTRTEQRDAYEIMLLSVLKSGKHCKDIAIKYLDIINSIAREQIKRGVRR